MERNFQKPVISSRQKADPNFQSHYTNKFHCDKDVVLRDNHP